MKFTFISALVIGIFSTVLVGTPAAAQATRTWVSSTAGVGDDANPCSRSAPCKTFAGAISKTAVGGEIDVLDPGGYGSVTITKSLTIDGGAGQVSSVLAGSGSPGIVISASGAVVTLRNLSINGNGVGNYGIQIAAAARVIVENCNIMGFGTYGIYFNPTVAGSKLYVGHSLIHDQAAYGIAAVPPVSGIASPVTLEEVELVHNGVGIFVGDNATVAAARSSLSSNSTGAVISTTAAPAFLHLDASSVSNNSGAGIYLTRTGGHPYATLSNTQVVSNGGNSFTIPVGGTVLSFVTSHIYGNGSDIAPNATAMLQ
jgi:hypothetical protein